MSLNHESNYYKKYRITITLLPDDYVHFGMWRLFELSSPVSGDIRALPPPELGTPRRIKLLMAGLEGGFDRTIFRKGGYVRNRGRGYAYTKVYHFRKMADLSRGMAARQAAVPGKCSVGYMFIPTNKRDYNSRPGHFMFRETLIDSEFPAEFPVVHGGTTILNGC